MIADKATLNKRTTGFAATLFPARMFCATGNVLAMNATGKSHKNTNNAVGKLCLLFTNSRIMNGIKIIKLITAAVF